MINVSRLDYLAVPIITIMICPHPYSHITKKHHKGGRGEEGGGEEKSADDAMKQIWQEIQRDKYSTRSQGDDSITYISTQGHPGSYHQ